MSTSHTLTLCVLFNIITNSLSSSGPTAVQSDHDNGRGSVPVWMDLVLLDSKINK